STSSYTISFYVLFFFQAEDGIRDKLVTGVQTCALPIYDLGDPRRRLRRRRQGRRPGPRRPDVVARRQHRHQLRHALAGNARDQRSEERRVGKECRSRWWRDHEKKVSMTD